MAQRPRSVFSLICGDAARDRSALVLRRSSSCYRPLRVAGAHAPLLDRDSTPHMSEEIRMPVQENHAFPRDLRHTAKNIDAVSTMRATLAPFLHFGSR
jgi:hypothetical protein